MDDVVGNCLILDTIPYMDCSIIVIFIFILNIYIYNLLLVFYLSSDLFTFRIQFNNIFTYNKFNIMDSMRITKYCIEISVLNNLLDWRSINMVYFFTFCIFLCWSVWYRKKTTVNFKFRTVITIEIYKKYTICLLIQSLNLKSHFWCRS